MLNKAYSVYNNITTLKTGEIMGIQLNSSHPYLLNKQILHHAVFPYRRNYKRGGATMTGKYWGFSEFFCHIFSRRCVVPLAST